MHSVEYSEKPLIHDNFKIGISTKRVNNSTTLCNPGINNYIS